MTSGIFFTSVLARTTKLLKTFWWVTLLIWLVAIAPAQASLIMRVAIEEGVERVKVGSSTAAVIRDGMGRAIAEIEPSAGFAAQLQAGKISMGQWIAGQIWIEPKGDGYVWIGDRWYRGRTQLVPHKGGITAVNYVDLEQYLYSVLGAEMDGSWPHEALKAQAVAARSYALHERQLSQNDFYDLSDTQASQVYKGLQSESMGTYAAVDATEGQVLTYDGEIILAAYHSSSGGHTENVEDVWSYALPYLRAVPDFDQDSPVYQWTETFSQAQMRERISGVGNILAITPERATSHGSAIAVKVSGDAGMKVVSATDITQALGLKSTRFTITPQKAGEGQVPTAFQIKGKGFGHAVGMSQWGAYHLARQGYNYHQILLHYYQATTLAKIEVR